MGADSAASRSNFEIARVGFWRSEAYRAYFEYLDQAGGFFYERWGDGAFEEFCLTGNHAKLTLFATLRCTPR